MITADKPPLDEDLLVHFGILGMKWGSRKNDHPGASKKVNKDAAKDAHEFARAKMFFGDGAGTRRKLIKATVHAKSKADPTYEKAFNHHLDRQNLGEHADKAKSERKRKDVKSGVGKTARGLNRAINGPFAATLLVTGIVAAYGAARASGLDQKVMDVGMGAVNRIRYGTSVDLGFLR